MDNHSTKKRLKVTKAWSYKEEEALIELWPSYECLYKTTSAEYKRSDKRAAAVEAIKRALETQFEETFTDEDIKCKMRNLRTQFGKEMGKVKSSKVSGTGTGDVYTPSWKWFETLDFLKDSISPVKTKPTPGVPICIDENDENQEPNAENAAAVGEGDDKELGTCSKTPTPMSKYNKKSTSQELETEVLNKSLVLLESATNRKCSAEDAEDIFGRHVAESLKCIKEQRIRELAKLKIQQVLFEAQFGVQQLINDQQPNPYSSRSPCTSAYYQA